MSQHCECRTDLGALFFISSIFKFIGFSSVVGLLAVTIVIEIGGLMLITGFRARSAAIVLALFLIVTTVFHGFWSADAAHMQDQLTQFLKNLAVLGGMLLVIERESAAVDPLRIIGYSVA